MANISTYCVTFLVLSTLTKTTQGSVKATCGDDGTWRKFSDTKCYKLIQKFDTWDAAFDICGSQPNPDGYPVSIATIKSVEEQEFITSFLFTEGGTVNNVWLGAHRPVDQNSFVWPDGQLLEYTNWAEGSPGIGGDEKNCVEIESGTKRNSSKELELAGQWRDVSCERGNWVMCERQQSWNVAEVQAAILQLRKEMEEKQEQLEEVRRVNAEQAGELDQLKENTVPAGFIYTELPGHPAPQTIWPQFQWEDVSASLAGQFFRVEGGNSAPFGSPQGADWSRITNVANIGAYDDNGITLPESGWSRSIYSGHNDRTNVVALRFCVEARENRPANVAVRLWKRGIRN